MNFVNFVIGQKVECTSRVGHAHIVVGKTYTVTDVLPKRYRNRNTKVKYIQIDNGVDDVFWYEYNIFKDAEMKLYDVWFKQCDNACMVIKAQNKEDARKQFENDVNREDFKRRICDAIDFGGVEITLIERV